MKVGLIWFVGMMALKTDPKKFGLMVAKRAAKRVAEKVDSGAVY